MVATGFCQSLVLNSEDGIIDQFGPPFSIAGVVYLPISPSAFTREGIASLSDDHVVSPLVENWTHVAGFNLNTPRASSSA